MKCFVDTTDFPIISGYRWHAVLKIRRFYAQTTVRKPDGRETSLQMHLLILSNVAQVDHKDRNGLNNRRKNLRPATSSQQAANQERRGNRHFTQFRGVTWHKGAGKFQAQIKVHGKNLYLGCFASEEEAARVYDSAVRKYFGEFANPNFSMEAA